MNEKELQQKTGGNHMSCDFAVWAPNHTITNKKAHIIYKDLFEGKTD